MGRYCGLLPGLMRKSDLLFFLTGAAALVYESVWIRLLSRLVGSDAGGLAVVLAVFMGGMGLGAWLFGGLSRRTPRPVLWFAGLEVFLGLWAALSPAMLSAAGPVESAALRTLLAAVFLLPPTLAMGATFPLMGRLTIAAEEGADREVSAFYGANTLGAATGALLAPLVFMRTLGLSGALYAAAGLDLLAALLALKLLRAGAATTPRSARAPFLSPILAATFMLGLAGMGLEVLLARLLVSVTGASVYAYAIVLCVFLVGIGLGSRQLASGATGPRWVPGRPLLALCALSLPALAAAGLLALRWQLGEADLFGALGNRSPAGLGILRLWAMHALFAGLALLPPAIALGAALPSAVAALAAEHREASRESCLARVYAFNTAGGLSGSLLAAFVLLPGPGPRLGLVALFALASCAGLLAAPRARKALAISLAVGGSLSVLLLLPRTTRSAGAELYLRHDAHATISVAEAADGATDQVRSLRVNGKVVATTAPVDLRLQRLLGHIPALYHGEVRRALVIGLGTGMTAGSLLDLPTLQHLDVFEISSAMPDAARTFSVWNGGVVDDPRTKVRIADGRHALLTSTERWDLITSDPIHPWTRGSSDLYSLEHFESMAAHLAPGGVASQWLPLYQLSEEDVQVVLSTWAAAFPHTTAWLTAYDLALVGSSEPLVEDLSQAQLPAPMLAHLAEAGVHSAVELAALEVARDKELREYARAAVPMRDERPVLEFRAPLSYLGGYSTEVLRWAGREEFVKTLPEPSRARAREVRALLDVFLEAAPRDMSSAARAYGRELLSLPAI